MTALPENTPRVLVVDDEPAILTMTKHIFKDEPVEIRTASSSRKALQQLAEVEFTLVLSDYQLPDMSGIDLLRHIQREYPAIRRVLTTAYMDEVEGLEGVARGLYAQIYPKPWNTTALREDCLRQLNIAQKLRRMNQLEMINNTDRLPTLPILYHRYQEAVKQNAPVDTIVDLLTENPAVVAQVLRIANSAFYGHQTISSLKSAIMTIGLNSVSHLLISVLLVDQLDWNGQQKQALYQTFIEGSLTNYAFMQLHELHFGHSIPEEFAVIGLLSYIGRILYIQYYPDTWHEIYHHQKAHRCTFHRAEHTLNLQDATAAQMGAALLAWWNIPDHLVTLTLLADDPKTVQPQYRHVIEFRMEAEQLAVALQDNPSGFLKKSTNGSASSLNEVSDEHLRVAMLEKYWTVKNLYTSQHT